MPKYRGLQTVCFGKCYTMMGYWMRPFTICLFLCCAAVSCQSLPHTPTMTDTPSVTKTDAEWLEQLGPDAYRVLRQKGTERPYSSEFETLWEDGIYRCKGCGSELFASETKFDAGCGWPSFYQAIDSSRILEKRDVSHGMIRTEVLCAQCGGHLGHVFPDGYGQPTGLRYCINGISLDFDSEQDSDSESQGDSSQNP